MSETFEVDITDGSSENIGFGTSEAAKYSMREISRLPIISDEESRYLTKVIRRAELAELHLEVAREKEDSAAIEELEEIVKEGVKAKNRLVVGHLRLAAHVARLSMGWLPFGYDPEKKTRAAVFKGAILKDLSSLAGYPLPVEDRIQAAAKGLLDAVAKYEQGVAAFSTFAMYHIEGQIIMAVREDRTIAVPSDVLDAIRREAFGKEELEQQLGRFATKDEIASSRLGTVSQQRIEDALRSNHLIPLHQLDPDVLTDTEYYFDEQELIDQIVQADVIKKSLAYLPIKERLVIAMRFGLVSGEPMTLEAIGHEMDITRARVSQLEDIAFRRLRGNALIHRAYH